MNGEWEGGEAFLPMDHGCAESWCKLASGAIEVQGATKPRCIGREEEAALLYPSYLRVTVVQNHGAHWVVGLSLYSVIPSSKL